MRPFTVLIGIVLGTAASITFSLGAVLIVFGVDILICRANCPGCC
jgi:hypothetical protein